MGNFTDAVGDAVKGVLCRANRLEGEFTEFFNELSPIDTPNFPRYWANVLCDDPTEPPVSPPFQGGQCAALYDIRAQAINDNTGQPAAFNPLIATVPGPITSIDVQDNGPGGPPGGNDYTITITGTTVVERRFTQIRPGTFVITSVTRADGQPDTCGDPPVIIPPYVPAPIPISVTYVTNEGDDFTYNGDVTIFAPVAITGPVTIVNAPVRVDLGPFQFDGTLQFSPEFRFDIEGPPMDRSPGDKSPDIAEPESPEIPDTPSDEETDDRVIGIYVRTKPQGRISQTEIDLFNVPDIYVPRLGQVFFRVKNGRTLGWAGPYDIKSRSAYVPAPANAFCVDARVTLERGWTGSTRIIRAEADFGA